MGENKSIGVDTSTVSCITGKLVIKNDSAWRYMSIYKFVDILINRRLYFTRLDKTGDSYDGELTEKDKKLIKDTGNLNENPKTDKKNYFVNCWHHSEMESFALWKIYSGDFGIAIRMDIDRHFGLFSEKIPFSDDYNYINVEYINYDNDSKINKTFLAKGEIEGHPLVIYKRVEYENEKEVRFFIFDQNETAENKVVYIDIAKFKEVIDIYINPFAKPFEKEAIKDILIKYGINENKIFYSNLLEKNNS